MNLKNKKCVACEGAVKPLARREFEKYLGQVGSWKVIDGDKKIERDFKFENFLSGIDFVNKVAHLADGEGHHPDIYIHDWNYVRIVLYTHAIGGLFINDFVMAAKIDELKK